MLNSCHLLICNAEFKYWLLHNCCLYVNDLRWPYSMIPMVLWYYLLSPPPIQGSQTSLPLKRGVGLGMSMHHPYSLAMHVTNSSRGETVLKSEHLFRTEARLQARHLADLVDSVQSLQFKTLSRGCVKAGCIT